MPLLYLLELHISPLDGRIKERQSQKPLVRNTYTFERSSVSSEELQFAKTFKTSEKMVIKEQMISGYVNLLSCNHPRLVEG
jgi:hypothetical protein